MWFLAGTIGFMLGAVFILFIGMLTSTTSEDDDHEHDWEVRGAQQLYRVNTAYGVPIQRTEEGVPITKVLYRCRECGEVDTETLDGHWTYEQLSDDFAHMGDNNTVKAEDQDGSQSGTNGDAVAGGDNPDGATGNGNN
jgi:hypothetical protein